MADDPEPPETDEKLGESTAPAAQDGTQDGAQDGDTAAAGRFTRLRRITSRRFTRTGSALVASALIVAGVTGLAGWLGYSAYHTQRAQAQREQFVSVARQGAVNLTTIKYTEVDADVQRILDLATGSFREDFEQRAKPFIEVVKAAQSKSEGTVTDAGLESQQGDSAQILVAVAVKSQTAGGEEPQREWRMRIEVRAVGDDAKVSNVVFVP
ncbi:Mce protein [Mycobacterium sherrisii]|uniref:Mce protein n=1 Tax=Mycobacterium sherrisii TaxID=243061 RepID=A0A1E3SIZ0_9MYCO|nr:Mce protein [Mycobacterium sherrisii]MCV7027648.1 Mce protein [Mycobacterium sherrisii]MEC4765075.1 Mce protein [Mycobacterium sherrisii]ODR02107.1 Mce protein [Mycobacterium sherrisii]ORW76072.1 Mce protein [Mycobacterium sherrisii]